MTRRVRTSLVVVLSGVLIVIAPQDKALVFVY